MGGVFKKKKIVTYGDCKVFYIYAVLLGFLQLVSITMLGIH